MKRVILFLSTIIFGMLFFSGCSEDEPLEEFKDLKLKASKVVVLANENVSVNILDGVKVYQRSDIFNPKKISSWKEKGKTITGTNIERMASGRALLE